MLMSACGEKKNFSRKVETEAPAIVENNGEPVEVKEEPDPTPEPTPVKPGETAFNTTAFSLDENTTYNTIEVDFVEPLPEGLVVYYSSEDDDATALEDYQPIYNKSVYLEAGSTSIIVPIQLINDLVYDVTNEIFTLNFTKEDGSAFGSPVRVQIFDDEDAPSIYQDDPDRTYSANELAVERLYLSHAVDQTVVITIRSDQSAAEAQANCQPDAPGQSTALPGVHYQTLAPTPLAIQPFTVLSPTFSYRWNDFSNDLVACFYAGIEYLDD